jgi:GNAT superfamily N-acetyltransferase
VGISVVTYAERPELDDAWDEVVGAAWPEFMLHDQVVNENWRYLFEEFGELQLYLVDEGDRVVGVGNTIPLVWDGTIDGLPGGVDDVLLRGISERREGIEPSVLSALQAGVRGDLRGRGLSRSIIAAMGEAADAQGFDSLIAPVRPTMKSNYPLTPIERYVRWLRDDGLPLDPWLRVHVRLGAEILDVARASMVVAGTPAEWEEWTEMVFPDSGSYVVPGALVPVEIDREREEGRYVEPNVWMRHQVDSRDSFPPSAWRPAV